LTQPKTDKVKNLSVSLNIILILAVAYLYFLHFKGGNKPAAQATNDSVAVHVPVQAKDIKAAKIVYVNADTLFSKYEYVKDLKREAEGKQMRLEGSYKDKAQKLQSDYAELQQKASSGALSSDQAKLAEQDIMRRKGELDNMERQLGDLASETQQKNAVLQDKVNKFLKEYNKNSNYNYILAYTSAGGNVLLASDSLNITNEVVNGLNEQYKSEKGKKK
jgi:outer membrane protein